MRVYTREARASLNIWGSTSSRFSSPQRDTRTFFRDCSSLPYRTFRERLTASCKSTSTTTMMTATKKKRRKREKRRADDDIGTAWSCAYTGGKSERGREAEEESGTCEIAVRPTHTVVADRRGRQGARASKMEGRRAWNIKGGTWIHISSEGSLSLRYAAERLLSNGRASERRSKWDWGIERQRKG